MLLDYQRYSTNAQLEAVKVLEPGMVHGKKNMREGEDAKVHTEKDEDTYMEKEVFLHLSQVAVNSDEPGVAVDIQEMEEDNGTEVGTDNVEAGVGRKDELSMLLMGVEEVV